MVKRNLSDTKHWLRTARTITEALPFMRRYSGKTFVIKYGGHAMGDRKLSELFARDVVLLKQVGIHPVVVHGGGPQIGRMLERLAVKSEFIDGLRVTDAATVEIVEMVLSGAINKQIVNVINSAGGTAIGLSGKDGGLIQASKLRRTMRDEQSNIESILDLGFVGEPSRVNPQILTSLEQAGMIPVIAPIGVGPNGETYNINADTVAGAIAGGIGAARLLLLTDVIGVLDKDGDLVTDLTVEMTRELCADGTIKGGMVAKMESAFEALNQNVPRVHIIQWQGAQTLYDIIKGKSESGTTVTP